MNAFRSIATMHRDNGVSYHRALREAWLYNKAIFAYPDTEYQYRFAYIRALVRMVYGR